MATGPFTASIDAWVAATKERIELVFKESAQRVIAKMQEVGPSVARGGTGSGHMPVDTGFLRASLVTSLNRPETGVTVNETDVGAFQYNAGEVQAIILAARIGDSIYAVYTAAYARRMEYGFSGTDSAGRTFNQEGYGFVRLAAQQWPQIVDAVVKEAKERVKAKMQ